jgi:hypothetical protein
MVHPGQAGRPAAPRAQKIGDRMTELVFREKADFFIRGIEKSIAGLDKLLVAQEHKLTDEHKQRLQQCAERIRSCADASPC